MQNAIHNWCFTLNNWTETDIHFLANVTNVSYLVYGKEVGENGTPHLQGYVELSAKTRFSTMKHKWGDKYHFEMRRGTQLQASLYCMKDQDYKERGMPRKQGERVDLDVTRRLATEYGMRAVTLTANLQQIKVAEKFLEYNEEPRAWETEIIWLYGASGAGKSRLARELCGDDLYTKNTNNKWFSGYDAHEYVILDDFRDSWMPLTDLLSLCDRYERLVETKGGQRQFKPKYMVITSIMHPNRMYLGCDGEPREQLLRRIRTIREIVPNVPVVNGNTNTLTTNEGKQEE